MPDDLEKIEIDLRRKETEAGWINIQDRFGIKAAPVWFSWLGWLLVISAFHVLYAVSGNSIFGTIIGISYALIWLYFMAFFHRMELRGLPFLNQSKYEVLVSLLISTILAFLSWQIAMRISQAIAAIQAGA